jgi:hypothetical protein
MQDERRNLSGEHLGERSSVIAISCSTLMFRVNFRLNHAVKLELTSLTNAET